MPLPLDQWETEQLRLSVFQSTGGAAIPSEWWEALAGSPPDESTSNPKRGSATVSGVLDSRKLVLGVELDRIDWLLLPEDQLAPNQVPSIGKPQEALASFSTLIESWLQRDDVPDVVRMAFGAVLHHPEVDHNAGYGRLPEYVPAEVDLETTDFLYQINQPKATETDIRDLIINRLSKWSVALLRVVAVTPIGPQVTWPDVHTLRVELDINTAATFRGPLPRQRLVGVFRELVAFGVETVEHGVRNR